MGLRYALLAASHPSLALEELRAIVEAEDIEYRELAVLDSLVIFESTGRAEEIVRRGSLVREVGELISISDSGMSPEWAAEVGAALDGREVRVEVTRVRGVGSVSEQEAVKLLCSRVSCRLKGEPLHLIAVEGALIAGLVTARASRKEMELRRPRRRPFFKPGTLDPQVSRLFVNLSRTKRGSLFLDPFCGAGGFVIEACSLGARTICGDLDWRSSLGARENLDYFKCWDSLTIISDATSLPLLDGSVEAVATDPPYGRSSSTMKRKYEELVSSFLQEVASVAKRGSYVTFAGPYEARPWEIAIRRGLEVRGRFHMFVHGALVREIVVARV
ncbi:MAG: RsmD family RNA methyltransferase [Acidilobaceae archaeon]|nr:RsmD family RNA methyltransferase [Acidilobaceae archaeon]MCX8164990.1 RsmD family RNA methyltransferase [Acidilobaceae archaeon]MDW7974493.1 RsmD family RNA methyltransferase [Sulfolobales archaeon]